MQWNTDTSASNRRSRLITSGLARVPNRAMLRADLSFPRHTNEEFSRFGGSNHDSIHGAAGMSASILLP
jgi:hypothetical protein